METCFFKITSLLKIIIDEIITNKAPAKVLIEGISFQMKYPKIIAKTKAKYFKGVTKETSENYKIGSTINLQHPQKFL